jgi:PAS domain S-box-containing protein
MTTDTHWQGGQAHHFVQFYDGDDYLAETVSTFLADGLMSGEPVIVIATEQHREAFAAGLKARGWNAAQMRETGEIIFADARDTLSIFMSGQTVNEGLFKTTIESILRKAAGGVSNRRLRAYGEMVDLLWRDGNPDAAIRVEELWNELARQHNFALLCAYPMGNFFKEAHTHLFEEICERHGVVLPAESFPARREENARQREIAMLQQRAAALEAEVAHRKDLERALRDALMARRGAEETLRRRERDLKDFVENASVGLHWVGPDGVIVWANAAEMALLGYAPDEYIGHHIAEFYADPEIAESLLFRLATNHDVREFEVRLRARDGSIKHVLLDSSVFVDNGKFVHTRCFTRDITERKRLEEANAFLLEASAVLNRSLDRDAVLEDLVALIVPRVAEWCAIDITTEDGFLKRVASRGAEIAGQETLSVAMTVKERTLGEIVFSRRVDTLLAHEVARRAATALENARLYELAQNANRIKDEFLATLSHELRTPLTAILGWARMLIMGGLDETTVRTAIETIERSARTQAALIDDLLDLSKVVTGKLTLRSEPLDVSSAILGAVETVRLAAESKGINIAVNSLPERIIIAGDPTRLQQIVWNLISNAVKFSHAGGTVTVSVARNSDRAEIVVSDSGRGIPLEFLPHVFEPFRQADGANTRRHGGLGLGLAIVKYLAELHGGSVTASSGGVGQGATFTVSIPMAPRRHVPGTSKEAADSIDLRGTSVLVVDDDADSREVVVAVLRRCGAEVHVAGTVSSACELLDIQRPDVLVTDIAMPDQDGFALVGHLRTNGQATRNIPVVALTAVAQQDGDERLRQFQAYVRKPVDPLHFARVIADLR